MLKDKIVFGVKSSQVREKLLTEDKLTLDKAVAICLASEQASKQLVVMESKGTTSNVNTIKNNKKESSQSNADKKFGCKRCGLSHKRQACPAFNQKCNKCSKLGHFAKMCLTKQKTKTSAQKKSVNLVQQDECSDDDAEQELQFYIKSTSQGGEDWQKDVVVGKNKFTAKLDTGANVTYCQKVQQTKWVAS